MPGHNSKVKIFSHRIGQEKKKKMVARQQLTSSHYVILLVLIFEQSCVPILASFPNDPSTESTDYTINDTVYGVIQSPNNRKAKNQNIVWHLKAPSGVDKIVLDFGSFNINSGSEFVRIFSNSRDRQLDEFTGNLDPFNVTYSLSAITVEFTSKTYPNATYTGFYATYGIPVTSVKHVTHLSHFLSNPQYPGYESGLNAIWIFQSEKCEDECISILFQKCALNTGTFLLFYYSNGVSYLPDLILTDNNYVGYQMKSPADVLTLRFTTAQSSTFEGFIMHYTIHNKRRFSWFKNRKKNRLPQG